MIKALLFPLCIISISSCSSRLYTDEIERDGLHKYFTITPRTYETNGKGHTSASLEINKINNDKVSAFIQKHYFRFDYLATKTFLWVFRQPGEHDSITLNRKMESAIVTDSFFTQFSLLTSGDRLKAEKGHKVFSKAEMRKIGSKFFICDGINPKDSSVSYHVCVGINGIAELNMSWDYTALEAFCFEAIAHPDYHSKLVKRCNIYIDKISSEQKKSFSDFDTYLKKVKDGCFASMENDDVLENALLEHYSENVKNLDFRIE